MFRGIERRDIFVDDEDRHQLIHRVTHLVRETNASLYAWAFMPNHVHLLVRPGLSGVSKLMHRLLGWYAAFFNRCHDRQGHLMQNRFKSILVQEEAYLLELVRYLHLNPVRAGLVQTIEELDRYPWTGHSRLMGNVVAAPQDLEFVLAKFGRSIGRARRAYREFVAAGWDQGRPRDLEGSGLRRVGRCWEQVDDLRRGRESDSSDERILGDLNFVRQALVRVNGGRDRPRQLKRLEPRRAVETLVEMSARIWRETPLRIASARKTRSCANARAVVCLIAVEYMGLNLSEVAAELGVSKVSAWRGVQKGRTLLASSPQIERHFLHMLNRKG